MLQSAERADLKADLKTMTRVSRAVILCLMTGAIFPGIRRAVDRGTAVAAERRLQATSFERDIAPILRVHCVRCHGPEKQESGFRLDRRDDFLNGGDGGAVVIPHKPDESRLIRLAEGIDTDVIMPPDGNRPSDIQKKLLRKWVSEGADWPERFKDLPGKP